MANTTTLRPDQFVFLQASGSLMSSINPAHECSVRTLSKCSRLKRFLVSWGLKFYNAMYRMQLPHYGGKYSIERMVALQEYTRSTSLLRVLFVVVSPPICTTAVLLCQESVPLQDPKLGWQANWGFWLRAGLLGIANGHEAISQIPPWVNIPRFSSRQIALFSLLTGIGVVAGGIAVSASWVFPIPFFLITLSLVVAALLVGLMRAVAGKKVFKLITSRKEELGRLNNVATLETLMCAGYPAYQILFTKVNGTSYELPVILMLSVIKLVMKRIFRSFAAHEEDMIPKLVVFTVDLFDSFYLATFMQRLSPNTLLVVMLIDIGEAAVELHEMYYRTRSILVRLNEVAEIKTEHKGKLLEAICELLHDTDSFKRQMLAGSRVRSCTTHKLSMESRALLQKLDDKVLAGSLVRTIRHSQEKTNVPAQLSSVVPLPDRPSSRQWVKLNSLRNVTPSSVIANSTTSNASRLIPTDREVEHEKGGTGSLKCTAAAILNESLEVLFTIECLVLTEYVEIIIPLIYGLFILVTVHLPSAIYHSEMEGVTLDNVGGMVSRMFVYVLLEFISFVALTIVTKRTCGIHVLYQLAFVLENEIAFVPSKLVLWILYTLTYRVAHYGPDFSFQFEWIKYPGK